MQYRDTKHRCSENLITLPFNNVQNITTVMKNKLLIYTLIALMLSACGVSKKGAKILTISTDMGTIKVKLYDETPLHTNNIVKLAQEKFYDGIIFHRVIKDFMIQGGDPTSKNPEPNARYGEGDAGYLLDAEFCDTIIHQRGAIAMAREGDNVNPERKSSSSQFYIVVGKVFTNDELDRMEHRINQRQREQTIQTIANQMLDAGIMDNAIIANKIDSALNSQPKFKYTEKQRKIYTTIGGTPHLDGKYTVFGEVIEGMDVVEKISVVKTNENDRPLVDIKMKIKAN